MKTFRLIIAFLSIMVITATVCYSQTDKTNKKKGTTFTGDVKPIGKGTIHTWVMLNDNGKPTSMGVTFTESMLEGLPDADSEIVLHFPTQAGAPPFNHFAINWNPKGHDPKQFYGVPHFDFHFYMISEEERFAIPHDSDWTEVPSQFRPRDYFSVVEVWPKMGVHWVDSLAKELHGNPFTETFIYGFYRGNMTFLEPMITKSYLETKPNFVGEIKLPTAYQRSGYYPTKYSIKYNAATKEYTIALRGLTLRQAKP